MKIRFYPGRRAVMGITLPDRLNDKADKFVHKIEDMGFVYQGTQLDSDCFTFYIYCPKKQACKLQDLATKYFRE